MASLYPGALDSFVTKTDGPDQIIYAAHVNDLQNAVVAIETELGTDPAGSAADLKTRLAIMLTDGGGFKGPQQVKIVAKANGEYTTIQSAIDAIGDATAAKPYVVLIFPAIYDETVTCKDHVHLVGQNPRSCKIDSNTGRGLQVLANITSSISNLYIRSTDSGSHSIVLNDGTTYMNNCIIEGASGVHTAIIYPGILHARNSQFDGEYENTFDVRSASTIKNSIITSSAHRAVLVVDSAPLFFSCQLHAGGNYQAIALQNTESNPKIGYCKLLKSGAATEAVYAAQAGTDCQIYHCSMNSGLHGNVNNLIGVPFNIDDADLT